MDENVRRKNFTLSEMVAIWLAMEKSVGGRGKTLSESDRVYRRKRASKILGVGVDTLSKAKQVVDYANIPDRKSGLAQFKFRTKNRDY